jgi:hypothetical protein
MEERIKAITNKKLYQQKKTQQLKKDDATTTAATSKLSSIAGMKKKLNIHDQLLMEKCKTLDLPYFLAPYIKINKHSIAFIAPNRNELLELCHLIVENEQVIRAYFSTMQDTLRNEDSKEVESN